MAQEYKVTAFKAGDFKDNFGNTWCEAVFEGVGEPVRWVLKDPSKISVGDVVFGHIEEAISKAGKPYNRFKTDKRDDYAPPKDSKAWVESDEKQKSIARSVALNNAVAFYSGKPDIKYTHVLETADKFLEWLTKSDDEKNVEGVFNESDVPDFGDVYEG